MSRLTRDARATCPWSWITCAWLLATSAHAQPAGVADAGAPINLCGGTRAQGGGEVDVAATDDEGFVQIHGDRRAVRWRRPLHPRQEALLAVADVDGSGTVILVPCGDDTYSAVLTSRFAVAPAATTTSAVAVAWPDLIEHVVAGDGAHAWRFDVVQRYTPGGPQLRAGYRRVAPPASPCAFVSDRSSAVSLAEPRWPFPDDDLLPLAPGQWLDASSRLAMDRATYDSGAWQEHFRHAVSVGGVDLWVVGLERREGEGGSIVVVLAPEGSGQCVVDVWGWDYERGGGDCCVDGRGGVFADSMGGPSLDESATAADRPAPSESVTVVGEGSAQVGLVVARLYASDGNGHSYEGMEDAVPHRRVVVLAFSRERVSIAADSDHAPFTQITRGTPRISERAGAVTMTVRGRRFRFDGATRTFGR